MLSCSTLLTVFIVGSVAVLFTINLQNVFRTWMCEASTNEVSEYNPDINNRIQELEYKVNTLEKQRRESEKQQSKSEEYIDNLEHEIQGLKEVVKQSDKKLTTTREEKIPRDCEDIFSEGEREDGIYLISPDGRCPFQVYCDMKNGGWTLMQRKVDGSVNFYRSWNEYVAGFGDINGEHWLGLDRIHRLTKEGSQIYFDIENYDNKKDYAHYKVFTVHEAATAYRMNADTFGYKGSIQELLSHHNNFKFSTYDRDNDGNAKTNCCQTLDGGGWWYNNCYRLGNVNGVFGKKTSGGLGYWTTKFVPIRKIVIKLKRIPNVC